LLINVSMSLKDGIELVSEIKKYYPEIKVIALSMIENVQNIIGMMGAGCCTYLLKTMHSDDLELALQEVSRKGHYSNYSVRLAYHEAANAKQLDLKEREREFLALACSDLTYQEIAEKMFLSFKTIDGYRAGLFGKFQVKSRVGLILEAIRQKLVLL
ncbi:MAG TPA: response regulator transcription factor, partial [Pseudosphingobacterium sp.]|nr:response regulator transcription factor [Pseudosphingobacterium sp.]